MVRTVTRKERKNRIEDGAPRTQEETPERTHVDEANSTADVVAAEDPIAVGNTALAGPEGTAEPPMEKAALDSTALTELPSATTATGPLIFHEGTSETLTEDQMRENIRNGAQGLRNLVDKYQEQHRVMQEEVAEAIIRDVQEQNQLHRLTANVLRLQQASLQNPEYTRWAYMNKKGEFSEEEDQRRLAEARERAIAMGEEAFDGEQDDGTVSNKSGPAPRCARSGCSDNYPSPSSAGDGNPSSRVASPLQTAAFFARREDSDGTNRYDKYVLDENKWMTEELIGYNSNNNIGAAVFKPPAPTITISLDALGDQASLAYIKGNLLTGGATSSDPNVPSANASTFVSRVPLPPNAVTSPVVPPEEKALSRLEGYFGEIAANYAHISGTDDEHSGIPAETSSSSPTALNDSSSLYYIPFVNGSILWPLKSGSNDALLKKAIVTSMKEAKAGSKNGAECYHAWLNVCLSHVFGGNKASVTTSSSTSNNTVKTVLTTVAKSLVNGDGADLLRDEGNVLVLVPFSFPASTATPYLTCRAYSFKGTTKAIEVIDCPWNENPLRGLATHPSVAATATTLGKKLKHLVITASMSAANEGLEKLQKNSAKPSNIVRAFFVPLAALGDDGHRTCSSSPSITLIDTRMLSPTLPFAAHQGALCWTDLCGLARADVSASVSKGEDDYENVVLRMPSLQSNNDKTSYDAVVRLEPFDAFSILWFETVVNPILKGEKLGEAPSSTLVASAVPAIVAKNPDDPPIVAAPTTPLGSDNSTSRKIEVTPALLAAFGAGVVGVAAVCALAGYAMARRQRN